MRELQDLQLYRRVPLGYIRKSLQDTSEPGILLSPVFVETCVFYIATALSNENSQRQNLEQVCFASPRASPSRRRWRASVQSTGEGFQQADGFVKIVIPKLVCAASHEVSEGGAMRVVQRLRKQREFTVQPVERVRG